ncbi:MAG TPA: D-glycerate dehydrogenase [Candidatus Dormibacteraeota bacterium]
MGADILCTVPLPDPFTERFDGAASLRVAGRLLAHDELITELRGRPVDVLCPQLQERIDAAVLDAGAPRLRCVSLFAVGFDNVDIGAATARGVVVGHTPGVLTDATADCAMGLILAAARRLCEGDREVRAGRWNGWAPTYLLGLQLTGGALGLVGFGRIGQAVARRALGFAMRIRYFDPTRPDIAGDLRGRVEEVSLDTLIRCSDVISMHTPLTDSTRHMIGEVELRAMRPTAILVNTSRGAVIDEHALVRALQERWIAGAGLDVYEDEPRQAPGLTDCDTVVLAPHLGSATVQTRAAMAERTADNALDALRGQVPRSCVNPAAWQGSAPGSLLETPA